MDFEGLLNSDQLPVSPFDLLGKPLTAWLEALLTRLGCVTDPVIEGKVDPSAHIRGQVYIAKGAIVEPMAMISGPAYIGPDSEVRHAAYIRGSVYVGRGCVVGHTTEAKGSCFFDGAKAGHFAYVGDSILCRDVNLGAGTKLANLKLSNDEVSYRHPVTDKPMPSGLRKFGALIGDHAQTGCNSVLSPGAILMKKTAVFPCVHFHGTLKKGFARNSR
jgi:NDP-sugar pyrophosphorylase family protein